MSRVALARCGLYDANVRRCVDRMLQQLGGIGQFVKPGQSVLVKPNLLTDALPERAVTTHPEVARAVIRAVRQLGACPFVADSPASVLKIERVWERTGFRDMCREEEVPLVNLEQGGAETFSEDGVSFSLSRRVLDADVIISVPKVKTHVLTVFTCGIKNMYGCVPGLHKTDLHKRYFRRDRFSTLLTQICAKVRPALTVADGILAMDGNGPAAGQSFPLGLLAASTDAAALDTTLCRLLGIPPATVPYLGLAGQVGLGETRAEHIECVGDHFRELPAGRFRTPNTLPARLVPQWLVNLLHPLVWTRPKFTERCASCGLCVRTCPAGALSMEAGQRPRLEAGKCIECCCCHEVCPHHAIDMETSPLLRLVERRKPMLQE